MADGGGAADDGARLRKTAALSLEIGKLYGGNIRGAAERSECVHVEGHFDLDLMFKDGEAKHFDGEPEGFKVQRMCEALQRPYPLGYSLWHDLWEQCKRRFVGISALFRLVKRGSGRPRVPKEVSNSVAEGFMIRVPTKGMFVVFRGYAPPPDSDTEKVASLIRDIESYGFHLRVHEVPHGSFWRRYMTTEEVKAEEAARTHDSGRRDRVAVLAREPVSDSILNFATVCPLRVIDTRKPYA